MKSPRKAIGSIACCFSRKNGLGHEVNGITDLRAERIDWDHGIVWRRIICRAGSSINIIIIHPEGSDQCMTEVWK